jgi:hypothetical protein
MLPLSSSQLAQSELYNSDFLIAIDRILCFYLPNFIFSGLPLKGCRATGHYEFMANFIKLGTTHCMDATNKNAWPIPNDGKFFH